MIRLLFRLLASAALAVAVIFAVLDATRSLAAGRAVLTPLRESWAGASPGTMQAAEDFVASNMSPEAWQALASWVLAPPGFAVFAVLALVLFAIGHRRKRAGRFDARA